MQREPCYSLSRLNLFGLRLPRFSGKWLVPVCVPVPDIEDEDEQLKADG